MLAKIRCERCGQYFFTENYVRKIAVLKYDIDFRQTSTLNTTKLCDKCYKEFTEFIRNKNA